ncbi:MAG: asparagine synthase (glutamine-hydrolyzing) [Labilithrix sp.]|nr:asparagine synthase (glutamine-hydrolyzing) [Labilithrix sp.]MBX3213559.1 asparagine synthase (glutamine-hydrolyzing) [Labilithrix sp.]
MTAVVGPSLDRDVLGRMVGALTSALSHRGPDHAACEVLGPVALGHARLRVVDPRPDADQPMTFAGGRLVFSGAILNHRELRRELEGTRGVVFRTMSDTEVLLHALAIYGDAALDRLQGMFAFVYHDVRRRRLLAARDRAGIKPLAWARREDGTIVLASEAQAILRAADVGRAIDTTALRQLLRFNHPLGDHTFFAHVRSLEPGCAMSIELASGVRAPGTSIRRWWAPRMAPRPLALSDAVDRLDASFRAAVERAADVDVPLGCYLSGGVDSSGIAAELQRTGRPARLYSLVSPGARWSEEEPIDRVTRAIGARTAKIAIEGVTLDDFVEYALRAEMPQWWTSDLALGVLARRAKADGIAVVLGGEGPDELFAGYEIYRIAKLRGALVRAGELFGGALARGRWAGALTRRFVPWLDMDTSVARAWLGSHDRRRAAAVHDHFGFHPENLPVWEVLEARRPLSARLGDARLAADYRDSERAQFRERIGAGTAGLSSLERNLHFEITERLPRWILHMGDRMSATHGVELRFPYLDDDFFAASLSLPMNLRATLLEDKRVLRRMHERRLPRRIARRRKQPLYTPTRAWLAPVLADPRLERYWSRDAFARADLLDFGVCDAARSRLARGAPTDSLGAMSDEWLFTFALTASILAVELCGA